MPVFVPILLAEIVRGIGETCISGAHQAWIADEVGSARVTAIYLRAGQVRRIMWLVGIAASVGLASVDLRLPTGIDGGRNRFDAALDSGGPLFPFLGGKAAEHG